MEAAVHLAKLHLWFCSLTAGTPRPALRGNQNACPPDQDIFDFWTASSQSSRPTRVSYDIRKARLRIVRAAGDRPSRGPRNSDTFSSCRAACTMSATSAPIPSSANIMPWANGAGGCRVQEGRYNQKQRPVCGERTFGGVLTSGFAFLAPPEGVLTVAFAFLAIMLGWHGEGGFPGVMRRCGRQSPGGCLVV